MITNTINDDKTIAGESKDITLAGRYHILCQLGEGGMGRSCEMKIAITSFSYKRGLPEDNILGFGTHE